MNLNEFLREWAESGGEYDQAFQRALNGDTTQAAEMWRAIAEGRVDAAEALIWARHVAQQVVERVVDGGLHGAERPRAALVALGFRGQIDKYQVEKELVENILDFIPEMTTSELVAHLRRQGYLDGMSEKTALNRVAEWRQDLPPLLGA